MRVYLQSVAVVLSLFSWATAAHPPWSSLAGLSEREIEAFARTVTIAGAHPPPGPDPNTHAKLVNNAAHPYQAPGPNDIRGPCPGLNTLASHGVGAPN
jgi:unspecific peroxygenase